MSRDHAASTEADAVKHASVHGGPSTPRDRRPPRPPAESTAKFWDGSITLFAIADFDGHFRELNPAWSEMLGFDRRELKGRPFLEFVHADDREATTEATARLTEGERVVSFENRYRGKDGTYRWLRWESVADTEEGRIYATARDVTEEKRLTESRAQLAHNVAHDLSNALTPMRMYTATLRRAFADESDAVKRSLGGIEKSLQRAQRLVQDVREVQIIDSGKLAMEPAAMCLRDVVEDVWRDQRPRAQRRQIALDLDRTDDGCDVRADEDRLHQVVTNLVTNALKFTPEGGRVNVRCRDGPEAVRVEVEDTGRGLDHDEIGMLFHPFSQVHERHEATERGTGLGLYICKGIVEAHGGTIGVESRGHGKGSTFWFELPKPGA